MKWVERGEVIIIIIVSRYLYAWSVVSWWTGWLAGELTGCYQLAFTLVLCH